MALEAVAILHVRIFQALKFQVALAFCTLALAKTGTEWGFPGAASHRALLLCLEALAEGLWTLVVARWYYWNAQALRQELLAFVRFLLVHTPLPSQRERNMQRDQKD